MLNMQSYYKFSLIVDGYEFNSLIYDDKLDSNYQNDNYKRIIDNLYGYFLKEITKNPIRYDTLFRNNNMPCCPSETIIETTLTDLDIKKLKIQDRIDNVNRLFQ